MTKPIKIFLVDDHNILRGGLREILNLQPDMEVVGEAGSLEESLVLLENCQPDIVIVDYYLKGKYGPDAIQEIKKRYPHLHFMALSSYDEKGIIRSMVKAGAISYMLKDAEWPELLKAIRSTAQGQSWFSQEISRILLQDLLPTAPEQKSDRFQCDPSSLTAREIEVLRLIVGEKTNREIADELHISSKTVENHRSNLMQKIGARNTAGLVKYALRHSLEP